MMTDIVADSLTRIRNAAQRRLEVTDLLYSKMVESIVKIFVEKGYLESYQVEENNNKKSIKVVLKYDDNDKSVINEIKKISKPGRRIYHGRDQIRNFKNGHGTLVVSTSQGVLPNDEAHKCNVGGEVICSIW